jgi:hypothetical protein
MSRAKEEGTFRPRDDRIECNKKYFDMIFRLGYQNCCEYESEDNCTFCARCQIRHRGSFAENWAIGCSASGEERNSACKGVLARRERERVLEDALIRNGTEYDCTWTDVLSCPQL